MAAGVPSRRQKRMGPAPFASFEDLSDEMESPEARLPGIREDVIQTRTLQAPNAPRIDISRASSSSHHDSRDSTPERELFDDPTTNTATDQGRLAAAFREEGALELRASTEELDYHDGRKRAKTRPTSPLCVMMMSDDPTHRRKDSQSSEIGLLSISGRTSRLSSIGSQGSGQSRLSNNSHLSVLSGTSGLSRSPSPHKMLLETSFCGTKSPVDGGRTVEKDLKTEDDLERIVLARKSDPTTAVLAEGVVPTPVQVPGEIVIKIEEPPSNAVTPKLPKKITSASGVEYIYIPLKGPMPTDQIMPTTTTTQQRSRTREPKSNSNRRTPRVGEDSPQYIRIKLKPDHMYEDNGIVDVDRQQPPVTLDLLHQYDLKPTKPPPSPIATRRVKDETKTPSPLLSRKSSFASLFRSKETLMSPESPTGRRRKTTLTGLFGGEERHRSRSKSRERNHHPSAPSSTESIDSKKSTNSVFTLFKIGGKSEKDKKIETPDPAVPHLEQLTKVEFQFNSAEPKYKERALDGDSIRIPLHSPGAEDDGKIETAVVIETISSTKIVEEIQEVSTKRQSSTSSENVVFTTDLGAHNEIFTTKLPKDRTTPAETTSTPPQVNGVVDETLSVSESPIPEVVQDEETAERSNTPPSQPPLPSGTTADDDRSSESERESEIELLRPKRALRLDLDAIEPERTTLVLQDSFEDELPYVPTTLPLERSTAIPIMPIRQRATYEMKTCPIERPRSTTPINPNCLEEYREETIGVVALEKLKISLPGCEARSTGPGIRPAAGKTGQKEWINFEEIPERRKAPKRIQTLPATTRVDVTEAIHDNVVYNYVNPEECRCECHEMREKRKVPEMVQLEDEMPLLENETNEDDRNGTATIVGNAGKLDIFPSDRGSVVSDSSIDLSTCVEPAETNGLDGTLRTPFTSDLGVSSNRSSIHSQADDIQSPDTKSSSSFNDAFPKHS